MAHIAPAMPFFRKRFLLLITLVKPNEERTPANFSNVFIHIMLLRSTDFGYYYVLRLDFSFKNNFDHWPVYWLEFGIKLIEDIKYVCLYATKCSRCKNLQMKDKSYQVILTMRSPVWIDRYNSVDAWLHVYQTKESVCIKRRIGKLQLAKNIKTTSVLLQHHPK